MRGRQFDRRTLTIAGVVVVLLVGFVLIFGDNLGLYGPAGKESEKHDTDGDAFQTKQTNVGIKLVMLTTMDAPPLPKRQRR
jgi:hypothetical protein